MLKKLFLKYKHYREVKFWLYKGLTFNLLKSKIKKSENYDKKIILYGNAIRKLLKNKK